MDSCKTSLWCFVLWQIQLWYSRTVASLVQWGWVNWMVFSRGMLHRGCTAAEKLCKAWKIFCPSFPVISKASHSNFICCTVPLLPLLQWTAEGRPPFDPCHDSHSHSKISIYAMHLQYSHNTCELNSGSSIELFKPPSPRQAMGLYSHALSLKVCWVSSVLTASVIIIQLHSMLFVYM